MISDTWVNQTEPEDDDDAASDPLLRPVWHDTPDETDADRLRQRAPASARSWATPPRVAPGPAGQALEPLLGPLCDATDALARLDARAAAAGENIRDGLIARMAFAEAAGWLAHSHAWIHPLDLALRAENLAGSTAPAVTGHGQKVLPHTFGARGRAAWEDQTFDAMAEGDRAVADALALVRTLPRLMARGRDPFADMATVQATLAPFAVGPLDPAPFAAWRAAWPPATPVLRRRFGQAGAGTAPLPPLLAAAQVASTWMESGVVGRPAPLPAGLAAASLLARAGPVRSVVAPLWAAYPAVGFGERDALPRLRSDAADRLVGWDQPVTWPLAFLHLVAEGARAGLRELDRLEIAAEQGSGLVAGCDKRSRLPDAVDALLRVPVLTPKALAARLKVAPQTGTALLRELEGKGFVKEVTGRGSFRAFAL